MLTFEQMTVRLLVALALGALIGLERELIGKDAGIRTAMLVSGGAGLFTMISVMIPSLLNVDTSAFPILSDRVISNIVVGIGFLGGGIIFKTSDHVKGLTTAAVVWVTAAIGTLAGLGLTRFAITAALLITSLLYGLRKLRLYEHIRPGSKIHNEERE